MQAIFSKTNPSVLLHLVIRIEDIKRGRDDLSDTKEALQVSVLKYDDGKVFRPHRHIQTPRNYEVSQESWIVLAGGVEVTYYDFDDKPIANVVLGAGDCSITYRGGHRYEILEDDTIVYEFKTGPYFGRELDKVFIND